MSNSPKLPGARELTFPPPRQAYLSHDNIITYCTASGYMENDTQQYIKVYRAAEGVISSGRTAEEYPSAVKRDHTLHNVPR